MSTLFRKLKAWLAAWLLQGWVLALWSNRKMRRLEAEYLKVLLENSTRSSTPEKPRVWGRGEPLRSILFIGDVGWEAQQLFPELQRICPVEIIDLHPHLAPEGRAGDPVKVAACLRDAFASRANQSPDVVLFYARSNLLSAEVFDLIRVQFKCPLLGLNLDDKIEFLDYQLLSEQTDNYQQWAGHFDLNLTNVRAAVDLYGDRGFAVYYMPEGYHLDQEPPRFPVDRYAHLLSFVGQWKPERAAFIEELRRRGVPITLMGRGWPGAARIDDPASVYRSSQMTLGISFAAPFTRLTTMKARDFECPGAGTCYLTTFNWELGLHFEIGREILCYRSMEELVEIFSFYRRRPDECFKIAQAGYERCRRDHTWEKRFHELFQSAGFKC